MRLVKFTDGTYGIRTGWWFFGWRFVDLISPSFQWSSRDPEYLTCCKGSLKQVYEMLQGLEAKHKVISVMEVQNETKGETSASKECLCCKRD